VLVFVLVPPFFRGLKQALKILLKSLESPIKRLETRGSILSLHLAPGGGEAIRLKPATPEEQAKLKAKG
jgi:hypothetical protein